MHQIKMKIGQVWRSNGIYGENEKEDLARDWNIYIDAYKGTEVGFVRLHNGSLAGSFQVSSEDRAEFLADEALLDTPS